METKTTTRVRDVKAALALTLLTTMGCGTEASHTPAFDGVSVELPAPAPVPITAGDACFVDAECVADRFCFHGTCMFECSTDADCASGDTCSTRRRCVTPPQRRGGGEKGIDAVLDGVGIANGVPTIYEIAPGQAFVDVVLESTRSVGAGAIGYSTKRFDEASGEFATDGQMRRASGTTQFTIPIATGNADPSRPSSGPVRVELDTSIGEVSLTLVPRRPAAGVYAGEVRIRELADAALPFDAELVTVPTGASLETATSAWLLLPVRSDTLFAPHAPVSGGPDAVAAPLTFDAFAHRWVASFEHSYALDDAGPFGALADDDVGRSVRVEVEAVDGRLVGSLSDRWSGLFDERTALGVRTPGDVVFQGSFELTRVDDARTVLPTPATLPTPAPGPREVPSLAACATSSFTATPPAVLDGTTYACSGLADAAAFAAATDREAQMGCAIAVGTAALSGNTVARQIQDFVAGTAVGRSFSDFIADCAAGTAGTCVPTAEVTCARQMLAFAHQANDTASPTIARLVSTYRDVNREANLGPQLAAFHVDTQTRLDWLKAQNYPAIVTSAVRSLNDGLLEAYRRDVLEVHLGVLSDQFSVGSLGVLGRASDDLVVQDARELMLLELSQSWRASADSLALAASRYSDLHQDVVTRTAKASYVRTKLFDLYVMSGVLAELNRLAGAGFASSGFAGGFGSVATELEELSQPFSSLIFTRDAEVVVSTSLDPRMGNDAVLSQRRSTAMTEVDRAATSVTSTLADLQSSLVDEATLRGRVQTQANELYAELVELCGVPNGCTSPNRGTAACRPSVEAGLCGFAFDATTDQRTDIDVLRPSEANAAVLAYYEARQARDVAFAELTAADDAARRYLALTENFAASIGEWSRRRAETDERIGVLLDEAQARRAGDLTALEAYIADQAMIRTTAAAEREAWRANWDQYQTAVDGDIATLLRSAKTASTAAGLQVTADVLGMAGDALIGSSGAESTKGLIVAAIGSGVAAAGATFHIAAGVVQRNSEWLAAEVERNTVERDFQMAYGQFQFDLQVAAREDQLAILEGEMEALATRAGFADMILETMVDELEGQLEDELAYERDLAELNDRRNELNDRQGELAALGVRVAQANITVQQRLLAYHQVVQRAALVEGRLAALEVQESELDRLLGSPTVVFGWANRLTQAESRLERAKSAMMDWLVALEYAAVRPFVDQRIQILLARNTYQLEEIGAELDRLQNQCGGALNTTNVSVSVARDFLGLDRGLVDPDTLTEVTPAERFRELLAEGVVPVDKRVRYTTDSNVGDLVSRDDVLAVSFDINLTDFANLEATCNAKVASIAIELVGTGLGTARPTVTLLYDGASSVRSCQPNIESIVDTIGRDATTFGAITRFRAVGRSVSPVAGINQPGSTNMTLQGLPLASQYTLLIDPRLGENGQVDWSKLEDVVLHIAYVSQDVFPTGQCQ